MKGEKKVDGNLVTPARGQGKADTGDRRAQPLTQAQGNRRMIAGEKLWGTQELADFLDVPIQTIYQWRKRQYGPPGRKMGRHIRYRRSEVERWIDSLDGWAA